MAIGRYVRKAFQLYTNHPIIIIPFLIFGLLESTLRLFSTNFLEFEMSSFQVDKIETLLSPTVLNDAMFGSVFKYTLLVIVIVLLLSLLNSFVEAYAIGLAKKMPKRKNLKFKDGLKTLGRGTTIFFMKVFKLLLFVLGAVAISIPSFMIFGAAFGVLLFSGFFFIYFIMVTVITFFASQSIIINKLGAWDGILESYRFLKRNLESVALLLLFNILLYVVFSLIVRSTVVLSGFFLSDFIMDFIDQGMRLIVFSLILEPFFVILKTIFFMKV